MLKRMTLVVVPALLALACKPDVATVEVTPPDVKLGAVGATAQLKAESKDKEGKALENRTYTWKSSSDAVATVDGAGKVIARGDGEATITATDGEKPETAKSGSAKVEVSIPSRVEVSPPTLTLKTGEPAAPVTARVLDSRGKEVKADAITWSTDKENVARVENGNVTAAGVGMATVTATSGKLTGQVTVVVTEGSTDGGAAPVEEKK
ncbi:MAG: Ig-like domain-containing protein [Myxococcota bacterium]